MRDIDGKEARVIAALYHGGRETFRRLRDAFPGTERDFPETLAAAWGRCEVNSEAPGVPWKESLQEELFGYANKEDRAADVAELEAMEVSEDEAAAILREMVADAWRDKVETLLQEISIHARNGETDKMEKALAAWRAERAKGSPCGEKHAAALRRVAPPWETNPEGWEQCGEGRNGPIMRRLPMLAGRARHAPEPKREVLIPGVMEIGRVTGFVGKAEFGKSILAAGTGDSIATGGDWFGVPVKKSGPVLILDNEMPENSIFGSEGRLEGLLPYDFAGPLCVHPMFDEMAWNPEASIRPEVYMDANSKTRCYTLNAFEKYLDWLLERLDFPAPPVAVILDGAAQFYHGLLNEISSDEPRAFVNAWRMLALRRGFAAGLVLHTPKNPGDASDAIRGGQGWADTFDHTIVGTKGSEAPDPETGKLVDVRGTIEWGKARYGDKGQIIHVRRKGLQFWQIDADAPAATDGEGQGRKARPAGCPKDYSAAKVRKAVPPGETVSVKELMARLKDGGKDMSRNTAQKWGDYAADVDGILEKVGTRYRGLPEPSADDAKTATP